MSVVGAVAIGKNEGERLRACLESLVGRVAHIVYVDSGSTDGSIELAEELGASVVRLDPTKPFTAARARNAGFKRLLEIAPEAALVQFVDGDCEVVEGWLNAGEMHLAADPACAAVCGRRRERHPDASVYNFLCDVEWDTPIGETKACGGDVLVRVSSFQEVDGYREDLIAGEEPELCVRLRAQGYKIHRLDEEMTRHDAAMTRFSQWWKRATRAGHAFAEGASIHGAPPERHWVRESNRALTWGLILPIAIVAALNVGPRLAALLALAYPLNLIRVARAQKELGTPRPWTVALFLTLAKFPEALGWLRFQLGRISGKRSRLIEYKS